MTPSRPSDPARAWGAQPAADAGPAGSSRACRGRRRGRRRTGSRSFRKPSDCWPADQYGHPAASVDRSNDWGKCPSVSPWSSAASRAGPTVPLRTSRGCSVRRGGSPRAVSAIVSVGRSSPAKTSPPRRRSSPRRTGPPPRTPVAARVRGGRRRRTRAGDGVRDRPESAGAERDPVGQALAAGCRTRSSGSSREQRVGGQARRPGPAATTSSRRASGGRSASGRPTSPSSRRRASDDSRAVEPSSPQPFHRRKRTSVAAIVPQRGLLYRPAMRGDRVEVVVDTGQGVQTFEIVATRNGRRLEVTHGPRRRRGHGGHARRHAGPDGAVHVEPHRALVEHPAQRGSSTAVSTCRLRRRISPPDDGLGRALHPGSPSRGGTASPTPLSSTKPSRPLERERRVPGCWRRRPVGGSRR